MQRFARQKVIGICKKIVCNLLKFVKNLYKQWFIFVNQLQMEMDSSELPTSMNYTLESDGDIKDYFGSSELDGWMHPVPRLSAEDMAIYMVQHLDAGCLEDYSISFWKKVMWHMLQLYSDLLEPLQETDEGISASISDLEHSLLCDKVGWKKRWKFNGQAVCRCKQNLNKDWTIFEHFNYVFITLHSYVATTGADEEVGHFPIVLFNRKSTPHLQAEPGFAYLFVTYGPNTFERDTYYPGRIVNEVDDDEEEEEEEEGELEE